MIACRTMTGTKMVPKEKLQFRPSAYGVVLFEGKILLTKMKTTGKLWLPGGGVDIGETLEDAVKREMWEECGIEVDVQKPELFGQRFFYYEADDLAMHAFLFVSLCTPRTFVLERHHEEDESIDPQWVSVDSLQAEDFQDWGVEIMEYLNKL